ncbi:MAG: MobP3 family relaxase [Clostridia bacterium]
MPKVILKSNYIQNGKGAYGKNLMNYIGTREGVEKNIQGYLEYMSERKGAEKFVNHGLFTSGDTPITLSKVMEQVGSHKGRIWMPIISLTREDAINTGFNNGTAWKNMLSEIAPKIADYYKIKLDNLCWYGAFHNEGHHPHVHMVVFSKDPNEGYLTTKGIEKFKSQVVKEVFALEMEQVYQRQSMERQEVKEKCREIFAEVLNGNVNLEPELVFKITELKKKLENQTGKKTYGYLPKPTKKLVDEVVDLISKNKSVKEAYEFWCETKQEISSHYTDHHIVTLPLSKQHEFKSIKNMIISEVDKMELNQKQELDIAQILDGVSKVLYDLEKLFSDQIIKEEKPTFHKMDKKAFAQKVQREEALGRKITGMSY